MEKITSRKNPLAIHLKKLGSSREYRRECSEFLCDGIKLLEEAVNCGADVKAILTTSNLEIPIPPEARVLYASQDLIDSLSPLKNAQGVLFSCRLPKQNSVSSISGTCLLLDGLQDPGNVGTIIRTSVAFGIKKVIITKGCADTYNPKTLRAAMGAVFKQRIVELSHLELTALAKNGARFIGAANGAKSRDISEMNLKNAIIAIGSEGSGLSKEVVSLCTEMVRIPISPDCESLNAAVAASVIMWETAK